LRIGAYGTTSRSIQSIQNYLTFYDIPDSLIGPNGDLLIDLRFALNRAARGGVGSNTPFQTGGVILAARDAAMRDASYEGFIKTPSFS
jgi:hypothetical protein